MRLRRFQVPISSVIDVGASDGRWSSKVMSVFPGARYHLIEANSVHECNLRQFSSRHRNVSYKIASAGDKVGDGYFHASASDPFGGVAGHSPLDGWHPVPMTTIDQEILENRLPPPYAIKLDTHGFEVPILAGAQRALVKTELLVIEVYNFELGNSNLLFYEMCQRLAANGFRCVDIFDPLYRPGDAVLWQFDAAFIPSSNFLFGTKTFW